MHRFHESGAHYHIIRERTSCRVLSVTPWVSWAAMRPSPALRMAAQFCEANPKGRGDGDVPGALQPAHAVQWPPGYHPRNSLFADGAAAAIDECAFLLCLVAQAIV